MGLLQLRGNSTRKLWESGASLRIELQRVRLGRTACPNHVALRFGSEDAAVEVEWLPVGFDDLDGQVWVNFGVANTY